MLYIRLEILLQDGCITPGIIDAVFIVPGGNECAITGYDEWMIAGTPIATISNTGLVHLQFTVRNTSYAGGSIDDQLAEYIASLTGPCIANGQTYVIDASNQQPGAMPAGSTIYVQPNGSILFTGGASSTNSSYAEININIYYQQ